MAKKSDSIKSSIIWIALAVGLVYFFVKDPLGLYHEEKYEVQEEVEEVEEVKEEFARLPEAEMNELLRNAQIGDCITFGVIDNDEYLEWRVLDKQEERILVITESLVDVRQFHHARSDEQNHFIEVTWDMSDIRQYINGELYDSLFNEYEKSKICDTNVTTPEGPEKSLNEEDYPSGGADTIDKLFLLSYDEVRKYFVSDESMKPSNEIYMYFDYKDGTTILSEIYRVKPGENYNVKSGVGSRQIKGWWLRTPGGIIAHSLEVNDGSIDMNGLSVIDECGIRPAMWITTD